MSLPEPRVPRPFAAARTAAKAARRKGKPPVTLATCSYVALRGEAHVVVRGSQLAERVRGAFMILENMSARPSTRRGEMMGRASTAETRERRR